MRGVFADGMQRLSKRAPYPESSNLPVREIDDAITDGKPHDLRCEVCRLFLPMNGAKKMARPKSPEVTFTEAVKALRVADTNLQQSKAGKERREMALAFAKAESGARAAKRRENKLSALDLLEGK